MKKVLNSLAAYFGLEIRRIPRIDDHIFSEASDCEFDLLSLKAFANRVADTSISCPETQAIRNLYLTGVLKDRPHEEICRIHAGSANTAAIGIWQRVPGSKDNGFVRRPDADWFEWAKVEKIEPKRNKWRVVFIGESVARGYLYDPEFTPASVLDHMLGGHFRRGEIDVIDLAKSSLSMQTLRELIGQSLALKPDVIVIFAGNNWHRHLTEPDIPYVHSLLREDGVRGIKSFIDARTTQAVKQLTNQVNDLVAQTSIKLIWVVPEFNLDDWNDPDSNAPLLARQDSVMWGVLRKQADAALAARDFTCAEGIAKRMMELDGGTSAVPPSLLAECSRSTGDIGGARRYREFCRDAEGWDPSYAYSPRTSTAIQNALREASRLPRNIVVDLPAIMNLHLGGALPNRVMFLDYCHLTGEGINVAMAAVASKVIETLTDRFVSAEDLRSRFLLPGPQTEGKASFLAAIHNAHYYQSYDLAVYWINRALHFWPQCSSLMRRFLDFQTRGAPVMACRSGIEIFDRRELVTLVRGGKKRLDVLLCKAMTDALEESYPGIGKEIAELRTKEHSVRVRPKELTDFYYSSEMLSPSEGAWTTKSFSNNRGQHCLYASAFWETSKFIFFSDRAGPVTLRLSHRVPLLSHDAAIHVDVNGHRVAEVTTRAGWQRLELSVLAEFLVDGLNEVLITWPDPPDCCEGAVERVADALLERRVPYFHRIFGEIHSFVASHPLHST